MNDEYASLTEILDHFELWELESIAREWHRMDDEIKSDHHAYDAYDVADESPGYIDRDIELDNCTFIVTTDTTDHTYLMTGITIWKDDFSVDAIDIDEIEQLINSTLKPIRNENSRTESEIR